jgi:hypothetical protein
MPLGVTGGMFLFMKAEALIVRLETDLGDIKRGSLMGSNRDIPTHSPISRIIL